MKIKKPQVIGTWLRDWMYYTDRDNKKADLAKKKIFSYIKGLEGEIAGRDEIIADKNASLERTRKTLLGRRSLCQNLKLESKELIEVVKYYGDVLRVRCRMKKHDKGEKARSMLADMGIET